MLGNKRQTSWIKETLGENTDIVTIAESKKKLKGTMDLENHIVVYKWKQSEGWSGNSSWRKMRARIHSGLR